MKVKLIDENTNEVLWSGPADVFCISNDNDEELVEGCKKLKENPDEKQFRFGGGASPIIIVERMDDDGREN